MAISSQIGRISLPNRIFWPLATIVILCGIPALFIFYGTYDNHIRNRPKLVIFDITGVTLVYRNKRRRSVPWFSIEGVFIMSGPEMEKYGRSIRRGGMWVSRDKFPIAFSYPIAVRIREEYIKAIGTPPFDWDGRENISGRRKIVLAEGWLSDSRRRKFARYAAENHTKPIPFCPYCGTQFSPQSHYYARCGLKRPPIT